MEPKVNSVMNTHSNPNGMTNGYPYVADDVCIHTVDDVHPRVVDESSPLWNHTGEEPDDSIEGSTGGVDPKVMARFSKVCILRRWLTVEPVLVIYFMTFIALIPLTQQYVLDRIKVSLEISNSTTTQSCQENISSEEYFLQNKAQAQASNWMILFNVVLFVPGFFSTILLGSYSDQRGRKIGLISPIVGGMLRCGCSIVVTALELPLLWMLPGLAVEGFSGGAASFIMAGFSYIADVTTHAQRSARVFLLEVAIGIGIVMAQLSIGFLVPTLGFKYCYTLAACLYFLNFLYTVSLIIETRANDPDARLISCKHITKISRLYFTDTFDCRRWKLLLALLLLFLSCVIELGSADNLTYFQIHEPLCFTPVLIGFWQAGNYAVRNLGAGVMVKVFNKRVGDTGLMLCSFVSGAVFYTLVSFTTTVIMMYSVVIASFMYSLLTPMVRSFISKLCSTDEQGTAFAGIALIQTLAMVVGDGLFNSIYAATVHTEKGLVFLIEAAFLCLGAALTVILIVRMRRETRKYLALAHVTDYPPEGAH